MKRPKAAKKQAAKFVKANTVRPPSAPRPRFGRRSFAHVKAGWRTLAPGVKCHFRSAWESNYGRLLQWRLERGEIQGWAYETKTFEFPVKRGNRFYLPDFEVTLLDGSIEFHEVKGYMDAASKTKLKRMKKYYPTVKLVVIDSKKYRELQALYSESVKGWEK